MLHIRYIFRTQFCTVKTSGKRTQEIEVYYNSVGVLDLPDAVEMKLALKERKRQKQEQQQKTA